MGLVGGGIGSFIGPIHRIAAELDREIEMVAGAFSQDAQRSYAAGVNYGIDPQRAYPTLEAMIAAEAELGDGIDFITIATPNHHHRRAATAALEAGLGVMSDKPMTGTLPEAFDVAETVRRVGCPYALTYTYSGYALVREMKTRIAENAVGTVRKVIVEYPQGWLAHEAKGKQAEWRVDPARAGTGGCIADIGVHAFHLAEFVTNLKVTQMLADLGTVLAGRRLDDDCSIFLRFENGARGVLLASQIEYGEQNGLRIRLYGDKGGMAWRQEEPNHFVWHRSDGGSEVVRAGDASLGSIAAGILRTPGGHPEGYLEAFANLYRDFAAVMRGQAAPLLPQIADGLRSMIFIDTAVRASATGTGWVDFPKLQGTRV